MEVFVGSVLLCVVQTLLDQIASSLLRNMQSPIPNCNALWHCFCGRRSTVSFCRWLSSMQLLRSVSAALWEGLAAHLSGELSSGCSDVRNFIMHGRGSLGGKATV